MTGAIVMTCALLLHPTPAEPSYNTTTIRVNKKTAHSCAVSAAKFNARARKNVCTCTKPDVYPKIQSLSPTTKDKAK